MIRNALPILLLLTFVGYSVGQEKITADDYYGPLRGSYLKQKNQSRRHVQKIRSESEGKITEEEWLYEYQLSDTIRYVQVLTIDGKTTRTEQINIGKDKYCKKDSGAWVLTTTYCIPGSGSGGPSNIVERKFLRKKVMRNGVPATEYFARTVYKNEYSKTASTDGLTYWETSYTIGEDGLVMFESTRRGLVKDAKPYYESSDTYEYGVDLRIEAPIK